MSRKPKTRLLPKWIKSWCCQYPALRFGKGPGSELRCKACGNMLFDDYHLQKLIVDGEPYDPNETVPYTPPADFK